MFAVESGHQTLLKSSLFTYRSLVFVQHLIVLRHGYAEDDGGHILKAVNPLFSLRPLSADVKQFEIEVLERKVHLYYASGFDASSQNILFGWHVVFLS